MRLLLKNLTLNELPLISKYLYQVKTKSSFYTIGGLYFFSNLYTVKYLFYQNILIIGIIINNNLHLLKPFTDKILTCYHCYFYPEDLFTNQQIICEENTFDYIYLIDDLITLKGKKYQKIRNHINQFINAHQNILIKKITSKELSDCSIILNKRIKQKYLIDDIHVSNLLKNILYFPILGFIIYDKSNPLGFSFMEIKDDVCHIHIEKIDKSERGLGDYFRIYTLKLIKDMYPNLKYVNRQDSLNLKGLIKQKESLRPISYLKHLEIKGKGL